jgi:hypothetical protein
MLDNMPKLTPIGQEKVSLSVNVDSQVKANAKARAVKEGVSISSLIQLCLEAYGNGTDCLDFTIGLDKLLDNH